MLAEDNLTFDKACKIALSMEAAIRDTEELNRTTATSRIDKVHTESKVKQNSK